MPTGSDVDGMRTPFTYAPLMPAVFTYTIYFFPIARTRTSRTAPPIRSRVEDDEDAAGTIVPFGSRTDPFARSCAPGCCNAAAVNVDAEPSSGPNNELRLKPLEDVEDDPPADPPPLKISDRDHGAVSTVDPAGAEGIPESGNANASSSDDVVSVASSYVLASCPIPRYFPLAIAPRPAALDQYRVASRDG